MKVTSQVDSILSRPTCKPDRVKTSFAIDRTLFDGFRALCEHRAVSQSVLLEALLADLLARHGVRTIDPGAKYGT